MSWDPATTLYAVRGMAQYWKAVTAGHNEVQPSGENAWAPGPAANTGYLTPLMAPSEIGHTLDQLLIQPPRHSDHSGI